MENPFEVFGLPVGASNKELKKAYRLYASKLHPDKHNGDPFFDELFKKINLAYDIIIDNPNKPFTFQTDEKDDLKKKIDDLEKLRKELTIKIFDLERKVKDLTDQLEVAQNLCSMYKENPYTQAMLRSTQQLVREKNDTIDKQDQIIRDLREEISQNQSKTAVSILVGIVICIILLLAKI